MEDYSNYNKGELRETLEEIGRPLRMVGEVAVRLCEILSCENCPVVIYKCDMRTETEKKILQYPCAGELHNWIISQLLETNNEITRRETTDEIQFF